MPKIYTDEFLISELQRFYRENGRVPTKLDMINKNGYPSVGAYTNHFGSLNQALKTAGLYKEKTKKQTEFEICCKCGCNKDQTLGWCTKGLSKDKVMCLKCYKKIYYVSDYKRGKLNKNSPVAKGFISQRIIANFLELELKDDCNCSEGFNTPYDLYDKDGYGTINVKSSKLHYNNIWTFTLQNKKIPKTYILVGFDKNRRNVLKGWSVNFKNNLICNKCMLLIKNNIEDLKKWKNYEINDVTLNKILHKMSEKRKETNGENCILSNDDLKYNYYDYLFDMNNK